MGGYGTDEARKDLDDLNADARLVNEHSRSGSYDRLVGYIGMLEAEAGLLHEAEKRVEELEEFVEDHWGVL